MLSNDPAYPFVFAADSPMAEVYRTLEKVRDSTTTVLMEGESGTGKDALAQWLHFNSQRKAAPYMKIDFSSLPEDLVESELFGYERGAFTGAMNSKLGKLDLAQGGTLVLDDIASVGLSVQAKLLNVVEAKQFYRLGGSKSIDLDSRIVALSTVPLTKAVERRAFRQDLFFRLNLITVRIPPLRERRDEVLAIAHYLLVQLDKKYKAHHNLHPECTPLIRNYEFPGNIRELRNALERAVLMSSESEITPQLLPEIWQASKAPSMNLPTLEDVEREHICEVMKQLRGKKVKAAKVLGISRKTLLEKRKKYGLQ